MTTTTSPPTFQSKEKINLTDEESHIFELLLQVVGHFNLQTQIRVVGGWDRDKILTPSVGAVCGNDKLSKALVL
ncbi:hypothetical protein LguiA_025997 [Lonicera macranthoides]